MYKRQINELEESVGASLFDRVSRKIVINENGKFYLSKVIPLLELYHDLETCSGALNRQTPIRVGSCAVSYTHLDVYKRQMLERYFPERLQNYVLR